MTKYHYEFKLKNHYLWEGTRSNVYKRIDDFIKNSTEDFQIDFSPCNKRSKKALAAYWMLIDIIVKWDSTENGLNKRYFHDMFMEEAGLVEEVDKMPRWKMIYKDKIKEGWLFTEDPSVGTSLLQHPDFDIILDKALDADDGYGYFTTADYEISLGFQIETQTRSIANKGDITKEEMEKLIFCILDFGKLDNNNIPGCEIRNDDLEKLLKFYEG